MSARELKRGGNLAIMAVVIAALLSAISIVITADNYSRGTTAARSVYLELSALELTAGTRPDIQVSLNLKNDSPREIKLNNIHFSVYLNGNFMGSNYEPLTSRELEGFEATELDFVIPLRPFYLQHIEQAQQDAEFAWFLRGRANLELPYNGHEFWVNIREGWIEPRE